MEEQQRTLLVPLKEDFIQFDVKEPEKPAKEEPKKQRSELHYLMINALSVITNGINHSHFKYMKQIIGEAGYDEYSFIIWRCLFIIISNYFLMKYRKEQMPPFSELCHNGWFWTRMLIQFFALETFLLLLRFFRVSTATCFISMAPLIIVFMSCVLLKEKFYMRYVYGVFICFGGVMLIVLNEDKNSTEVNGDSDKKGIANLLCSLICGVAQLLSISIHRVSSKILIKQNVDMNTQLMYPSFACIVLSFISLLITGESLKFSFLLLFHCGINCLIWLLSTSLILMSFKGIELVKTTAIGYLNIVTVFILGVTFLGEHIYLTDVIGSLIILGFNIYNTMYPPLQ